MKTKKFYAVCVYDSACNDEFHQEGIYGRGDYSWMNSTLNGGENTDLYCLTKEEAEELKADFDRIIKEENLEWASTDIDELDVPVADTLQDVADDYNEDGNPYYLERMIEANKWTSDCGTQWGICHNDKEKVVINDKGEAEVVSL